MYEFEETLLILENPKMIAYLENVLREVGVWVSKRDIEDRFTIKRYPPLIKQEDNKLNGGPLFNFSRLFQQDLAQSGHSLSSINQKNSWSLDFSAVPFYS